MCAHSSAVTIRRTQGRPLPLPVLSCRPQCHSHSHNHNHSVAGWEGEGAREGAQATDKLHLQLQFAVCIAARLRLITPSLNHSLTPLCRRHCPALPCPPLGPVSLAAPFYHCVRLRGLFARVNIKFEPQANEPSRAEPSREQEAGYATFFSALALSLCGLQPWQGCSTQVNFRSCGQSQRARVRVLVARARGGALHQHKVQLFEREGRGRQGGSKGA